MMKQIAMTFVGAALGATALLAQATGARAEGLTECKVMTTETALELAQATLESCREQGYQVAVVVVDRFGLEQVVLRDRFAGPHTVETATRKAWTAVSFRIDTKALAEMTQAGQPMAAIRDISKTMALGGGRPVEAGGGIVGGVGVSGAPDPSSDDSCAQAGVAAVQASLEF